MDPVYPMRINRYLAFKKHSTRRGADALIEKGRVFINGRKAVLGDKVMSEADVIEVREKPRKYRYFAFNKPRGIETGSPIGGVFPMGRLDKDSQGLMILTDDGRVTDALLNPDYEHEKEYAVSIKGRLPNNFKRRMERGVNIEGYTTKPCTVNVTDEQHFTITLTEGKKHQIRRMCANLGQDVATLKRIRIMNVRVGNLAEGSSRELVGAERAAFLQSLGLGTG